MIYKFIDDNDAEITVNSLSSLQSLVDSETIREDTQVKAGLRGKWTPASKIKELVFPKDEIQETEEPKEDIKSFITKEEPKEEVIETPIEEAIEAPKEEVIEAPKEEVIEAPKEETNTNEPQEESSMDTSDYYTEVFMKKDNNEEETYKDEIEDEEVEESEKLDKNVSTMKKIKRNKKSKYGNDLIGVNFFEAIQLGFKNYFNVESRSSRSEYWYWFLFVLILGFVVDFADATIAGSSWLDYSEVWGPLTIIYNILTWIPGITIGVRRLHDVNRSGWWLLISLTVIGLIPLFIWAVSKGTEGKNRYGNNPLKFKKNS